MLSDFINQREDPPLQLCSGVSADVWEHDEQMQTTFYGSKKNRVK